MMSDLTLRVKKIEDKVSELEMRKLEQGDSVIQNLYGVANRIDSRTVSMQSDIAGIRKSNDRLENNFDTFKEEIKNNFDTFKEEIKNNFDTFKEEIKNNFDTFKEEIKNNFDTFKEEIKTILKENGKS